MRIPTDAALVAAARSGDRAAFGVLVARYGPVLLAACRRALGEPVAASDAAQEAVLAALVGLDGLRRDEAFGAWLVGIGLNRCRRLLRSRSWERPLDGDRDLGTFAGEPEDRIDAHVVAVRVRDAIAGLPAGQREAIVLFYLAGLTQREVAEHLGTAEGAVKSRLHKARASLRAELTDVWKEHFAMSDSVSPPVPVQVADVRRTGADDSPPDRHVVLLQAVEGDRELVIWIGAAEATALALALQGVATPRPGTYGLAAGLLEAAGGRIEAVRVSRLVDLVFHAEVVLGDGTVVDARPSDALNLAVLADRPILVDPSVFTESMRAEPVVRASLAEVHASERTARTLVEEILTRRDAEQRLMDDLLARVRAA